MKRILILLLFLTACTPDNACLSEQEFRESERCLVIYKNKVYDMTTASKWDITGHFSHKCGKEYDKHTIESGGHPASVMNRFYYADLC